MATFQDREDAAKLLAKQLESFKEERPLILAIPRGAVPMADLIAHELNTDMDIVLVKKLGAPGNPEYAIGSVSEFGDVFVRDEEKDNVTERYIWEETQKQLGLIKARRRKFEPFRETAKIKERTVIIVDDGIATGATMLGAIESIRKQGAKKVVVAAPVASPSAKNLLESEADELVFLSVPDVFYAVGQFYIDFNQVADSEVAEILKKYLPARRKEARRTG